jgi:hypothetical protein
MQMQQNQSKRKLKIHINCHEKANSPAIEIKKDCSEKPYHTSQTCLSLFPDAAPQIVFSEQNKPFFKYFKTNVVDPLWFQSGSGSRDLMTNNCELFQVEKKNTFLYQKFQYSYS